MYEIDVKNKATGECDTIFGYSFHDACKRNGYEPEEFICVSMWYVD